MGVADEFSTLKDNCTIGPTLIESISYRYKRITRQLNSDFWNTTSEVAHSRYVGSYGRNTAIRSISDLDVAYELPSDLYTQHQQYAGNGPSALLQKVKASIQRTYSTSDTFGDGQVVVVSFDDGIRFEVLPHFNHVDGSSFIYPNANNGGSWQVCNPRAEINAIASRSTATNNNLKHLCRMMRCWVSNCNVPLSGMLLDTLAYQFIDNYEYRDRSFLYHDFMARDFFRYMANQDSTQMFWRAPGSASWVRRSGVFEHKARSAELRAQEAIAYDQRNNDWSRRQKWREVFGSYYPS